MKTKFVIDKVKNGESTHIEEETPEFATFDDLLINEGFRQLDEQFGKTKLEVIPSTDTSDAEIVRSMGPSPMEFLVRSYLNPFVRMGDRIRAATSVLDYTHKRLGNDITLTMRRGNMDLSRLSDEELMLFTELMSKMEGK